MYAIQPPLTPRKAPRQARSRALVEAIIEATARIFEREGAAACTTNAVAEIAGVSIGSLYQYFPNRHALTAARCFRRRLNRCWRRPASAAKRKASAAAPSGSRSLPSVANWARCSARYLAR